MKIMMSPAKKMAVREDVVEPDGLPMYIRQADRLKRYMQGLSYGEARRLWACNDRIAALNYGRFREMDLYSRLTPAILSYEGIQYQYLAPGVMESAQWAYVQEHLRILSGFYGVLRPLDGVVPYRLEMMARVRMPEADGLYRFWGRSVYEGVIRGEEEAPVIVNLASKEYSRAVEPYLDKTARYVTCVFGSLEPDGAGQQKVKVKATQAKMARGEMVRFMAEQGVEEPEGMKWFDRLGYRFAPELSDGDNYVFLKGQTAEI